MYEKKARTDGFLRIVSAVYLFALVYIQSESYGILLGISVLLSLACAGHYHWYLCVLEIHSCDLCAERVELDCDTWILYCCFWQMAGDV